MIDGVIVQALTTHPDDRGYFREIVRDDDRLLERFGQVSITETYPGVIKAFHWHERQDDLWYVASGMAQVVLYDRRPDSPTKGQTDVIYAGEQQPVLIKIPKGVAHGYRVLGQQSVVLVYVTTASYQPTQPDEQRIPFDDPTIGFDWATQHR
ncbi:MAG: dTDP-4-dehydrorhamnose 3,5-epimerase family protein [Candidatus Kerfeldbacteria bacterium]|nr:dTDP-4-dehydrorhamnose 3,5-epimerase family protein [Candidatus Kerfeldbacteria bacterium]